MNDQQHDSSAHACGPFSHELGSRAIGVYSALTGINVRTGGATVAYRAVGIPLVQARKTGQSQQP